MVVLKEIPEPFSLSAVVLQSQQRSWPPKADPVTTCPNDRKQSETPYIHSVAFDTNLMPLATRDLRSPYMDSGDYAC